MDEHETATKAFPLYWPEGYERTPKHERNRARFKDRTLHKCRKAIEDEVARFKGKDLIISSNFELRKSDGMPRSGQRQPEDPGVAIFFKLDGEEMSIPCDTYMTVEDNLWALVRTLDALRQIERDGNPTLGRRAFRGFAALPDPTAKAWHDVLRVDPATCTEESVKQAHRQRSREFHPDVNHSEDAPKYFHEVQEAYKYYQDYILRKEKQHA